MWDTHTPPKHQRSKYHVQHAKLPFLHTKSSVLQLKFTFVFYRLSTLQSVVLTAGVFYFLCINNYLVPGRNKLCTYLFYFMRQVTSTHCCHTITRFKNDIPSNAWYKIKQQLGQILYLDHTHHIDIIDHL